VEVENIFLGNGSDEAIDLLMRAFCEPRKDNIVSVEPSYGMYEVCASLNDVEFKKVLLTEDFQLKTDEILKTINSNTKLIFLCSPNNPTGNSFRNHDILTIIKNFGGLVIVDEAYIDFSTQESLLADLKDNMNLVVLQTFSKAWGLAGIRLGMAFADSEIVNILNKIKYPYNINSLTLEKANEALISDRTKKIWINEILKAKEVLMDGLANIPVVKKVYPSDSNFILVRVSSVKEIYKFLVDKKIIVRDRSNVILCEGCLRITVGTKDENSQLLDALKEYV
jgi:histidinol-phosphate aminotransferase